VQVRRQPDTHVGIRSLVERGVDQSVCPRLVAVFAGYQGAEGKRGQGARAVLVESISDLRQPLTCRAPSAPAVWPVRPAPGRPDQLGDLAGRRARIVEPIQSCLRQRDRPRLHLLEFGGRLGAPNRGALRGSSTALALTTSPMRTPSHDLRPHAATIHRLRPAVGTCG
jgi:hypothetical protein